MKKFALNLIFPLLFCFVTSCAHDDEVIVDCFADLKVTELKYSKNPVNPRTVNYSIDYVGKNKVTYVRWTFGDGSHVRNIKTPGAVSHTYKNSGNFEVKADVTISRSGESCTMNLDTDVIID
ncbi:PKD domain-containing protein [Flavobacterium ustbae]|uniref:PKD domain-containing protein n=1 Tax=Flavobacterium ustbae TaxID=2488790 RepID=UPI000F7B06A1|nr:PKD domain-containing protein [Flavobacterium ustbae]